MKPLISIIVPVYNTEKYLERCVESLLSQTYRNIEVCLVDDGSTDNSGKLCDGYEAKDPRVNVIHKTNGGLSSARNAAMHRIHGEYITYVDSDDFVDKQYVEYLYELIEKNNAQVSSCGVLSVDENDVPLKKPSDKTAKPDVYTSEDATIRQFYQKGVTNHACGKLFARSCFNGVSFPENRQYEDLATVYRLFGNADKIVIGHENHYFYLQRRDSIMHSSYSDKKMDRIAVSQEILEYSKTGSKEFQRAAECRLFVSAVQVLRELPDDDEHNEELSTITDIIDTYKMSVLKNNNAKPVNRLIAFTSIFLRPKALKKFGTLYKKVYPV